MKTDLKLKVKVNPGYLASEVMRKGVYDAYTDALLDAADEFQKGSPVGATKQLKSSWQVQNSPRQVAFGFEVTSNIINTSEAARNRIAGRPPGTPPPVQPLVDWVEAKGIAVGSSARSIAFAIRAKIAREGTERYKAGNNWVGINNKGDRIPGGRLEQIEREIADKIIDRIS